MSAQNLTALRRANEVRALRFAQLREIREGASDPAEVIRTTRSGLRLAEVITAIPRMGRTKAADFCAMCGVSEIYTLGPASRRRNTLVGREVTDGEREKVARAVESMMRRRRAAA